MLYLIVYTTNCDDNSISFKQLKFMNEIKTKYKQWAVLSSNAFIIGSTNDVTEIRNHFLSLVGISDKLFITKITKPAAWSGYDNRFNKWVKNSLIPHNIDNK